MTYEEITQEIRLEMGRKGMSYEDAALEAGLGTSTVYDIISRHKDTKIGTLLKLAEGVGMTLEVVQK